jgi:hypothetical protein
MSRDGYCAQLRSVDATGLKLRIGETLHVADWHATVRRRPGSEPARRAASATQLGGGGRDRAIRSSLRPGSVEKIRSPQYYPFGWLRSFCIGNRIAIVLI